MNAPEKQEILDESRQRGLRAKYMKKLLFTLLAIVALTGCAPDHIVWAIDGSLSDEQRTAFYEAADDWNMVASRMQYVSEDNDGDHRVFLRAADRMPIENADGVYQRGSATMFLRRGMSREDFKKVVMHEMGHALGLDHIEAGPSLMNQHATSGTITPADIEECKRVGACD